MADVPGKFFSATKVRTGVAPSSSGSIVGEPLPPVNPPGSSLNSVGLTMPSAFTVSNSPLTANGTIGVAGAGTVGQYIRGDGSLADFPESSGGGSSVSYYLNGSISQGTIGGVAYKELNKVPILGAGTDFTINADGYIASFITDAGDPSLLEIPGGNWNFETYFSASSSGGTPTFYVELYKVSSGGTATLIASSSSSPELIAFGTNLNPYFSTLAVPTTTLDLTDRLAIRYYVTHSGRTITLHTENNHLCQVVTTFTTGLTSLNGLTAQVQNLAVGTSGTDFNIASATATHTFNLPTASATNRGALSSADWSLFTQAYNDKINSAAVTGTTTKTLTLTQQDGGTITASWSDLNTDAVLSVFGRTGAVVAANGDYTTAQVTESGNLYYTEARVSANTDVAANTAARHNAVTLGTANGLSLSTQQLSLALASGSTTGALSSTDWTTFNNKQNALGYVPVPETRTITINGTSQDLSANRTYNVGTVTSVAALTLGTSGTDLSSTVANGTTTPVITLNVPTASATNRGALSATDWTTFNNKQNTLSLTTTGTSGAATLIGATLNIPQYQSAGTYVTSVTASSPLASSGGTTPNITIQQASGSQNGFLSSTDWTTFNNKQNALTNPVTGSGSSGQVAYFNGTTSITSESNLFWDATNDRLGIGTPIPSNKLQIASGNIGLDDSWSINFGSGSTFINGNSASNFLLFVTSSNEAMRIFSSRNVHIGPTPASDDGARLQVSGAAHIGAALNSTWAVEVNNLGTTNAHGLYVNIGASSTGVPFAVYKNFSSLLIIENSGAATFSSRINGVVGGTAYNTAGLWLQGSNITDGIAIGGTGGGDKTIDTYGGTLKINGTAGNGLSVTGAATFSSSVQTGGNIRTLMIGTTDVPSIFAENNVGSLTQIRVFGTSASGTLFGVTRAGWSSIDTNNGLGLLFGTTDNAPIVIGTNNIERVRIFSTGATTFSSSVTANQISSIVTSGTARVTIGDDLISEGSLLNLRGVSGGKTWFIANNYNVVGALEFIQSTTNGGTTPASSAAMQITSSGNVLIGTTTDNGSKLRVNGSLALPHVTKSANYTLDGTDYTVGFDCASNRTATLPDATTCSGRIYVIYQYNTGSGARSVTLDGNGSQTINGATTYSLYPYCDFTSVMIQSNGSNWIIIASNLTADCL